MIFWGLQRVSISLHLHLSCLQVVALLMCQPGAVRENLLQPMSDEWRHQYTGFFRPEDSFTVIVHGCFVLQEPVVIDQRVATQERADQRIIGGGVVVNARHPLFTPDHPNLLNAVLAHTSGCCVADVLSRFGVQIAAMSEVRCILTIEPFVSLIKW